MAGSSDIIKAMQQTVLNPTLAKQTAEAQAMQVVSMSCASVVMDGAQYVQAVSVVSAAAIGTFTAGMVAQVVATGDPNDPLQFQTAIQDMQKNVQDAATTFEQVGQAASSVLTTWKSA